MRADKNLPVLHLSAHLVITNIINNTIVPKAILADIIIFIPRADGSRRRTYCISSAIARASERRHGSGIGAARFYPRDVRPVLLLCTLCVSTLDANDLHIGGPKGPPVRGRRAASTPGPEAQGAAGWARGAISQPWRGQVRRLGWCPPARAADEAPGRGPADGETTCNAFLRVVKCNLSLYTAMPGRSRSGVVFVFQMLSSCAIIYYKSPTLT